MFYNEEDMEDFDEVRRATSYTGYHFCDLAQVLESTSYATPYGSPRLEAVGVHKSH